MATCIRGLRAGALAFVAGCALWLSAGAAQAQCVGDCNGDGMVAINELIIGVNIALGAQPVSACPSFDANGDGMVTINELIIAVNNALGSCPAPVDTATATETVAADTPTPTEPIVVNTPTATNTTADTPTPTDTVAADTPSPTPTETVAPPLGKNTCTLNGAASSLVLSTQAFTLPQFAANGSIEIDCGAPDANGEAPCSCVVKSFNPVIIPGIGDVCVNPFPGCPAGRIDCDGGGSPDVALAADHNIGACTSNAECLAACDAMCAGLGETYQRLIGGCEGYCQGGTNNDAECTMDSQCPGGQCVGAEPPAHIGVCNCSCGGDQLGTGSPAGALSCNVGTQIDVELPTDGDCDDPNTIILPGVCGGVSTSTATGQILDVNNSAGTNLPTAGPKVMTGAAGTCAAFAGGSLTGVKLVGELAFFDSTLGDILSQNTFVCQ
ncbi:MAG: hypothetical protein SF182_18075 [Deltaproteobacteria bacterium]|nr:hypothetical protein [Deltaproteobacteria bacterium]